MVDDLEERRSIIVALHDEHGHKGRKTTAALVRWRYYWDCDYKDVVKWIKECPQCQKSD